MRHPEVRFTSIRKTTLTRDLAKVKEVYNAAWQANWGFVPMTRDEFLFMAKDMKTVLDPNLVLLGEAGGRIAGQRRHLFPNRRFDGVEVSGRAHAPGTVRRIRQELGTNAKVIATGGLAGLIAQNTPAIEAVEPSLVLDGIRLIWERVRGS